MQNIFIDGTWSTSEDNTNITRLHQLLGGRYYPGPGTDNSILDRIIGGAFGKGTGDIVDRAFDDLQKDLPADELNIFGFSRGACAARMLAAKLADDGVIVNFLGCFDTVGAMGIPVNILGIPFQKINLFTDMKVHENVLRAAHAVALHEDRSAFVSTPMEPRDGIAHRGFPGDHGEIGSGDETLAWMLEQFER